MHAMRAACRLIVAGVLAASASIPALAQPPAPDPYFEFLVARRLEAQGDDRGALAAYERAAAADPASAEIRAEIASFHMRQQRLAEAEKTARAALDLNPETTLAHRVLGLVYATQADAAEERGQGRARAAQLTAQAITHLEKVMPTPAAATDLTLQFNLGRMYLRANQPEKAIPTLTRVLEQNPYSEQVRLALAQAQFGSDKVEDAIATLEPAAAEDPRAAATLGFYYERLQRWGEAADAYATAAKANPGNRDLRARMVSLLLTAKRYDDAASAAADAEKQFPEDVRFTRLHARALFDAGKPSGAIALMEGAARKAPDDAQTQLALANLYDEAGREPEAEKLLRALITKQPRHAESLNYLGYMLAERGEKLDEAVALVKRALEVAPDNPSFLDSLGWALFKKGDVAEAEAYLDKAAKGLPTNSVIQDHHGDVLAKRGRWADAIAAWRRALAGDLEDVDKAAIEKKIAEARTKVRNDE